MIRIGVVGYGYWGPNLVRNFGETCGASVVAVADLDRSKLASLARRYPAIKLTTDFTELLSDPNIDAIAVATPVHTHYELGLAALRAGKHLWMEKPMTQTVAQAKRLVDEAARRRLTLLVDHTFIYTGAVAKMGELIKSGDLGSHPVLRLGTRESRAVPARRGRHLRSGGARLLDPRLSARRAAGRGHRQRHQSFPGHSRKPGVRDAVLRLGTRWRM